MIPNTPLVKFYNALFRCRFALLLLPLFLLFCISAAENTSDVPAEKELAEQQILLEILTPDLPQEMPLMPENGCRSYTPARTRSIRHNHSNGIQGTKYCCADSNQQIVPHLQSPRTSEVYLTTLFFLRSVFSNRPSRAGPGI